MSEMVERVAQAMIELWRAEAEAAGEGFDPEDWEPGYIENMRKLARAAIEAMREPTEEMLAACMPAAAALVRRQLDMPAEAPLLFVDAPEVREVATTYLRAMIDAALSPAQEEKR